LKSQICNQAGSAGGGDGRLGGGLGNVEGEAAAAEGDLVAGLEPRRAGDLLAVEQGAVLGGHVVQFAPEVVVDHDRTVPARHALVADHHVVVREPADAVESEVQRVDVVAVFEVEGEPAG